MLKDLSVIECKDFYSVHWVDSKNNSYIFTDYKNGELFFQKLHETGEYEITEMFFDTVIEVKNN